LADGLSLRYALMKECVTVLSRSFWLGVPSMIYSYANDGNHGEELH